ncbi:MAG: hypothetical protein U0Q16_25340 [Bryobacteraceae bacterium]
MAPCLLLVWPIDVMLRAAGPPMRLPWWAAFVGLALVVAVWRWCNPLLGVAAAMIGARAASAIAMMLMFGGRSLRLGPLAVSAAGLALAVIACRGLASLSGVAGRWARLAWLAAAVLVPMAAIQAADRFGPGRFRFVSLIPLAIAVAASAIGSVALRPLAGWRWSAVALLLALTLPTAASRYSERQREQARADRAETLAALPAVDRDAPYPKRVFHRGVCFTAEGGAAYGSPESRRMLEQLADFGVDSIALVPYFGIRLDPLRIEPPRNGGWESEDGMEILARLAHAKGMRVLLKPHGWRAPAKDAATHEFRQEWFKQYGALMEHYARFAARIHADLFAIGTELGWLAEYPREWREVARRVRATYPGPLTYAATQGPEFEGIEFWDALDYIGLDNYYPLGDDYSTAEMMRRIEAVQRKFGKPVLFTEAGYSAAEGARRSPWEDETGKPLSLEEQAKCYRALLSAFHGKEWFAGVYWWKVGTNGYGGPANNSMTPWRKPAMDVVREFYAKGTGSR